MQNEQEHQYHVTKVTGNKKVGPIATTTTSRDTCPDSCLLKRKEDVHDGVVEGWYSQGCYAEQQPLSFHWDRVDQRKRGTDFKGYIAALRKLPWGTMVRGQQAGDSPGDGIATLHHKKNVIIATAMTAKRKTAWTYCAYLLKKNLATFRECLALGYAMNKSCFSLEDVDEAMDHGVPATVVVPWDLKAKRLKTPKGRDVVGCPAQLSDDITCSNCGGNKKPLCARIDRKFAVMFYGHGAQKKLVAKLLAAYQGGA